MSSMLGTELGLRLVAANTPIATTGGNAMDTAVTAPPISPVAGSPANPLAAASLAAAARRFGSAEAAATSHPLPTQNPLIKLRSEFDPAKNYTLDEKFEIAKRMPNVVSEFIKVVLQKLQNLSGGRETVEEFGTWRQKQLDWFSQIIRVLEDNVETTSESRHLIICDITSSSWKTLALLFFQTQDVQAKNLSQIFALLEKRFFKECLLVGQQHLRISHPKKELAERVLHNLILGISPAYDGNHLILVRPLAPSTLTFKEVTEEVSLRQAPWPLDLDDLALCTYLEILGWTMTQTVDGDQGTLRINCGSSIRGQR